MIGSIGPRVVRGARRTNSLSAMPQMISWPESHRRRVSGRYVRRHRVPAVVGPRAFLVYKLVAANVSSTWNGTISLVRASRSTSPSRIQRAKSRLPFGSACGRWAAQILRTRLSPTWSAPMRPIASRVPNRDIFPSLAWSRNSMS